MIHSHLLRERPSKSPNHRAESAAMLALVQSLAGDPAVVAQRLVEAALDLASAGSAGLSLVDTEDGRPIFRWIATAGEYTRYLHGTMPRDFSPCGEVLRRGEPLLMRHMVRFYPYVAQLHVRQHGSDVRVCYLAEPAIDLLDSFEPSVVLLDIGMPRVDGYEACRRMRAKKGDAVRLVALTGWGQAHDRARAEDAGFDAHLTKPVDFDRLVAIAAGGRSMAPHRSPA